ncbi:MAG: ATP-binding protein [bacterium]|nr:ATP-binding protein [bacterium]
MKKEDINTLVVEDNPGDLRLVSEMLRESRIPVFRVTHAGTLEDTLKILGKEKPDIILLDLDLPDSCGLESLREIVKLAPWIPIVVLTGVDDENLGIEAIQNQASDYLVKGKINVGMLVRSIRYSMERKVMEEVLRRDREMLEKLVNEKARELLNVQKGMEQAKRLTDIGTLAATVAHELRNPLAVINVVSYNLKRKINDPDLKKQIHIIENKVMESDQIINNLLFYSRLRKPFFENVNIQKILSEVIELIKFDTKNIKKARITAKCDPIMNTAFEADPLQLKELFINIVNNSFDALADKKGAIEIIAKPDINKNGALIYIKDNGSGIDSENLSKIWEPFFSTKSKGTGLGLSVCRQIILLHNGTIDIKSEKGKGTTVIVGLPCKQIFFRNSS